MRRLCITFTYKLPERSRMPNWVYNQVVVTNATQERLETLAKSIAGEQEQKISFDRLIPMPPESKEDWYAWNISNWGTKWDASDGECRIEEGKLVLTFSTAWSPPEPIYRKLCENNPDLSFEFVFNEEQGWGAKLNGKGSSLTLTKQWEIPESHADMIERGNECFCDDDRPAYDDCFSFRASARVDLDKRTKETASSLGNGWSGSFDELLEASKKL